MIATKTLSRSDIHTRIVTAGMQPPVTRQDYQKQGAAVIELTGKRKCRDRCDIAEALVESGHNDDSPLDEMLAIKSGSDYDKREILQHAFTYSFTRLAAIQLGQPVSLGIMRLVDRMRSITLIDVLSLSQIRDYEDADIETLEAGIRTFRERYFSDHVVTLSRPPIINTEMRTQCKLDNLQDHPSFIDANFKCVYCDVDLLSSFSIFSGATLDHFQPRSAGGPDSHANRVSSCSSCDRIKGAAIFSTLAEARTAIASRRDEMHATYVQLRQRIRRDAVAVC